MGDWTNKRKPAAERVARMAGSTTYRDFGEAMGASSGTDPDDLLKGALGFVAAHGGDLAAYALETYYTGSLCHEKRLRALWDKQADNKDAVALSRISCALAIRQFAGGRMSQTDVSDWAWLVHTRRDTLEKQVAEVLAWLDEARSVGELIFRKQLRAA
jgi:hypothetical protein